MAEPVLLISSDSFLGPSLEAVARGRLRVARLDPSLRPVAWPAEPAATVILDVTARQRDAFHTWVRRHHPGPMVLVLKPGERPPTVPRDPDLVVVGRPFRLVDLVTILEHPPPRRARARRPRSRARARRRAACRAAWPSGCSWDCWSCWPWRPPCSPSASSGAARTSRTCSSAALATCTVDRGGSDFATVVRNGRSCLPQR
ncbi:MAG: hypothetical protein ACJ782_01075 [Actinomycetota bacterium]